MIYILHSLSHVLIETNWHKHHDSTIAIVVQTNCYNPVYNFARTFQLKLKMN